MDDALLFELTPIPRQPDGKLPSNLDGDTTTSFSILDNDITFNGPLNQSMWEDGYAKGDITIVGDNTTVEIAQKEDYLSNSEVETLPGSVLSTPKKPEPKTSSTQSDHETQADRDDKAMAEIFAINAAALLLAFKTL